MIRPVLNFHVALEISRFSSSRCRGWEEIVGFPGWSTPENFRVGNIGAVQLSNPLEIAIQRYESP